MRIKRFFEKAEYSETIENYFSDILDHLDNAELEITQLNSNLYEVEIYPNKTKMESFDSSAIGELNRVKNKNKWQLRCLEYIENAINALNNDNNIERVIFKELNYGFSIKINTMITKEDSNEWISVLDEDGENYVVIDDFKLKNIIKEKFNVELQSVSTDIDYDDFNDVDYYVIFMFNNPFTSFENTNVNDIISYLKESNNGTIFKKRHHMASDRRFTLFLNNGLQFY